MRRLWWSLRDVFAVDPRALAAARIGVGLVVLLDLAWRSLDLEAHYTDAGVLPRSAWMELLGHAWRISLHLANGSVEVVGLFLLVHAAAAVALMLGYRTRLATVVCWLLTISLHNRNMLVLTGADTVLRMLLLWGAFVPWAARWSLDAALADEAPAPSREPVRGVAVAAWMVQVFLVHEMAGLLKTGEEWRSSFTALYYTLSLDIFQLPAGAWLLRLPPEALQAMTALTMAVELVGPFLLFPALFLPRRWHGRVRMAMVVVFVLFHLGLALTLELGIFPWVNIVGLLVFLPAPVWDRVGTGMGGGWLRCAGWLRRATPRLAAGAGDPAAGLEPPRTQRLLVAALLAYVVVWNLGTLPAVSWSLPYQAKRPAYLLRLDQTWNLFAPRPMTDDGWYVIPGRLRNGREVDIFRHGAEVSYSKPADVSAEVRYRWRKYQRNLRRRNNLGYRRYYAEYLCRSWNGSHEPPEQVERFRVFFLRERTPPPGEEAVIAPDLILEHRCFGSDEADS